MWWRKVKKPANFRPRAFEFWLPDPDSNQGPAELTESQARGNLFNINVLQQKNQFV